MEVYLPIAQVSLPLPGLVGIGFVVGVLSAAFGVGGGFLITPLLIFAGVPPIVAVASSANQLVGISLSGFVAHFRARRVDFRMAACLTCGGLAGSLLGVAATAALRRAGLFDVFVATGYVVLLGVVGSLMVAQGARTVLRRGGHQSKAASRNAAWSWALPPLIDFPASSLRLSLALPLGVGFLIGALAALLGVGGGFLVVPAMIHLLGMPTRLVPGTSLLQTVFIAAAATILNAWSNASVDAILVVTVLVGGLMGAQLGSVIAGRLGGTAFNVLLGALIFVVALRMSLEIFLPPAQLVSVEFVKG